MADDNSNFLRDELKEFINTTKVMIDSKHSAADEEEQALTNFAERVWNLNHFSLQLLNEKNAPEDAHYNARIIKDLTEATIYHGPTASDSCSLMTAADRLKKDKEFTAIKNIMSNFIKDQIAAEVLLDNLSVIYKELAA
ncbi:MAG: hypothetical protein SP4CHLAM5_06510 [Chlamydiia bacterium]|nr:hypothetical protein [Chlamydiia bacterium]MCH9618519.1 hypothetical protein [Chlamydiia bacterium]MCH9623808.1 hypothetical protein [Chlamydiia bacterium]